VFTIEMLPAAQGDCLWIEYGTQRKVHRVIIDGGTAPTYDHLRVRIKQLPPEKRRFDLLIVSHVDADHIEGIVVLLQDESLGLEFSDVWFKGWKHLPDDKLGPAQGEMLSALLSKRRPSGRKHPWNRLFGRKAVQASDDLGDGLPVKELDGGMKLTLLSPTRTELVNLAPYWDEEVRKAHLDPGDREAAIELLGRTKRLQPRADLLGGPEFDVERSADRAFRPDHTKANGSSIAVLAEYEELRCLLAADAHAKVLLKTIPRLLAQRPGLRLDAFKLPHHGSRKNVSLPLVHAIPARNYLFSSSGAIYKHPDEEAVSRVLIASEKKKRLWFNYSTVFNERWKDRGLLHDYNADARFPDLNGSGMGVKLSL
jgi:hypothetical protein